MSVSADALPRWLRRIFIAISDAPLTNFKSVNGEILTYATFILLVLAEVFALPLRDWLVYAWLGFLAGKVGFAVAGAAVKRATYKPSPPGSLDVEDIAATTPTPDPAVVLTQADAQRAASALETTQAKLRDQGERG